MYWVQVTSDGSPFIEPPSLLLQRKEGRTEISVLPVKHFLQNSPAADKGADGQLCSKCPSAEPSMKSNAVANATDNDNCLKQHSQSLMMSEGAADEDCISQSDKQQIQSLEQNHRDTTPNGLADVYNNQEDGNHDNQEEEGKVSNGDKQEAHDALQWVSDDVIEKWGHVLDIVTPDSLLTNCFTKTYSRFAKVCCHLLWDNLQQAYTAHLKSTIICCFKVDSASLLLLAALVHAVLFSHHVQSLLHP